MNEIDTAEIRILRANTELNNRIIMQATTPEQRAILRGSIENLRRELTPLWNPSTSTVKTTFAARSGQFDGRVSTVLGRA